MWVRLKAGGSHKDIISAYQEILRELRVVLDSMRVNVEKILYANIITLEKPLFSSSVIIELSLNKDFEIIDYDRSIDITKVSLKSSYLKMEFWGSINGIKGVFTVTIESDGSVEVYAYNNKMSPEKFDKILKKTWSNFLG